MANDRLDLQDCLEHGRTAKVSHISTENMHHFFHCPLEGAINVISDLEFVSF